MIAKKVTRVLMCRPTYYRVDYAINPHMKPGTSDKDLAMKQWQDLVSILNQLDIKVEVIDQYEDVPDMVFATDQGIVKNNVLTIANFRYPERQKESEYYAKWFSERGYQISYLEGGYPFEGGDSLFFNDTLFVGTGYRASVGSCEELSKKLNTDVIPLRLMDPFFYHLDMSFLPLNSETVFYYPPAISTNSQNILKKLVPNLVELDKEEILAYCANAFVSGIQIIITAGASESFKDKLRNQGMIIHEADVSEFLKGGGGIHCLINVLDYA